MDDSLSVIRKIRAIGKIDVENADDILNDISVYLESPEENVRLAVLDLLFLNKHLFPRYKNSIEHLSKTDYYDIVRKKAQKIIDSVTPPEREPCCDEGCFEEVYNDGRMYCLILTIVLLISFIIGVVIYTKEEKKFQYTCKCIEPDFPESSVQQKFVLYPFKNGVKVRREVCMVNGTIVKVIGIPSRTHDLSEDICDSKFKYTLSICLIVIPCVCFVLWCCYIQHEDMMRRQHEHNKHWQDTQNRYRGSRDP